MDDTPKFTKSVKNVKNGLTRINVDAGVCLLVALLYKYLGQQAKSRKIFAPVDDPGTKSEKEAAAASCLRSRRAQNLAKRYPS